MKSHVTLEQHACPATGKLHDTGALLLDQRLRERFEPNTTTGWSFCPEVQEKLNEGFVVLVGIDASKSNTVNGVMMPDTVWRTGEIIYLKREAADKVFDTPIKNMAFVDADVIKMLLSRRC
jgi:hypothetical protein